MPESTPSSLFSPRGLRYVVTYLVIFIVPFLIFQGSEGMTAIIFKTLGYITLPISLLTWLINLDIFHQYFWVHITVGVVLDVLFLLWIGSLVERRENQTII
jgi:hypothetical protein